MKIKNLNLYNLWLIESKKSDFLLFYSKSYEKESKKRLIFYIYGFYSIYILNTL